MINLLANLLLLSVGAGQTPTDGALTLSRTYTPGEKLTYFVRGALTEETRQGALQTFMPSDVEINYRFNIEVKKMKADGIAALSYLRPTMNLIDGETFERGPKTTVMKSDFNLMLDASPVNELLDIEDLNAGKKKPGEKKDDGKNLKAGLLRRQVSQGDAAALTFLFQYEQEIQRLALCIGSLDSGLDFAPRFPLEKVKVGDTWKKTVGYSPQRLKGEGNKQEVQRLDYVYTYRGLMDNGNGKQILRVDGSLTTKTDLVEYATQLTRERLGSGFVRKAPLTLEAKITFDLDPKTMHTLKAVATSKGGTELELRGLGKFRESRFKGKTVMTLEKRTVAPAK